MNTRSVIAFVALDNDRVDAGEIGAGHTVTAIYELVLQGSTARSPDTVVARAMSNPGSADEVARLRLRYKLPEHDDSQLIEHVVRRGDIVASMADNTDDYRFAAAVAGFGQWLHHSPMVADASVQNIAQLAVSSMGPDTAGRRAELVALIELAMELDASNRAARQ